MVCIVINCIIAHRNSNAPLVNLNLSNILIMKMKTSIFLDFKGSIDLVDPEILAE